MPRVAGMMERTHQPLWDTLVRTTGDPGTALVSPTKLFGNANVGNLYMTNLATPGQLASNQTFVILSMRVYLYFNGTNRRVNYLRVASQLFWTLTLGEKPQFQAPTWYLPAGGGIWGTDSVTSIFSNGVPSQQAILKLARPIVIPKGQTISVEAAFYAVGSTNALTGLNTGASDDEKIIAFMIDGQKTRDVQ